VVVLVEETLDLTNRHQVLMEDLVVVAVVTKVPRHLEEREIE
jgi:hypothetical protein|tara:strand:+ start:428 stop:553 length:126 start_codon:yes stop_codon:yes gene_type:complete